MKDAVAVITLDNPPVNVLSLALRRRLENDLRAALGDPAVAAIVIQGAGRGFSAGGDITEFDGPAIWQEPSLNALMEMIELSSKPIVACLHGSAVGGGLELALSCHARVARSDAQIGLPEVHLGLIPGAGGTQRLPRLVGLELAFNLICLGQIEGAHLHKQSGLLDAVTDGDVLSEACSLSMRLSRDVQSGASLRRTRDLKIHMANAQAFLAFGRATVTKRAKGVPAPLACVDCLEFAVSLPFSAGMKKESETISRLTASPQFFGLRHAFLAERRAAAEPTKTMPPGKARDVQQVAVIGAGTMGTGIVMSLVNAGLPVEIIERSEEALDRGLAVIKQTYQEASKRGKLDEVQIQKRLSLIHGSQDFAKLCNADLVIEAVFEDMEIKRSVFAQIDALAKPGAILASNTSMLDVNEIAHATGRPQDILGLHFFSPAHVMKLLEIVEGKSTSKDAIATALALARRIGKTPVVSGVCEGFIGNRMLQPYLTEAGLLLDEGALPEQVDQAIERWGMAMGPFRVCDLAGNDLGGKIREQRLQKYPELVYSRTASALEAAGRFGQKVGRGWYDYRPGQRAPVPSQEVEALVFAESARLGLQRRRISDDEIVDRLILALVNEGAHVIEDGIARRASDVDVVYVAGYGFPRWRGGPMFYADRRGLVDVLFSIRRLQHGPAYQCRESRWRPAELLQSLASGGQTFTSDS
ncbi:MAG: 3-hydroxyacyl-CoA dehydrogenase NAD-binding domain-containing protein [Steroidobacteraceae bacterium]